MREMKMYRRFRHAAQGAWRGLGLAVLLTAAATMSPARAEQSARQIEVYKSPWCGCCAAWVDYLEENGFSATVHEVEDLSAIKRMAGVAREHQSCHTAMIDGYVIEGHVPVAAIDRLLAERPAVRGLSVPGMPQGSPGMEGPDPQPFAVYSFGAESPAESFMEFDAN